MLKFLSVCLGVLHWKLAGSTVKFSGLSLCVWRQKWGDQAVTVTVVRCHSSLLVPALWPYTPSPVFPFYTLFEPVIIEITYLYSSEPQWHLPECHLLGDMFVMLLATCFQVQDCGMRIHSLLWRWECLLKNSDIVAEFSKVLQKGDAFSLQVSGVQDHHNVFSLHWAGVMYPLALRCTDHLKNSYRHSRSIDWCCQMVCHKCNTIFLSG